MNDQELIQQFAAQGSEEAFRQLVERHSGLVYYTALRQLGNSHAAEEVTQAVFIALAQKAAGLSRNTRLTGWLFRATRFAASNFLREQVRRQQREQQAFMLQTTDSSSATETVWARLSPHLNDALDRLSNRDRDAILLRFFQEKSHREVAAMLGTSEVAVKMRVSRALEKLRLLLARQGLLVSASLLLAALSAYGAPGVPAGLNASLTAAAAVHGAAARSTLTKILLQLMAWSKTKAAMVTGILLIGAGVTTSLVLPKSHTLMSSSPTADPIPADRSTPKGSLLLMAHAMENGDSGAFVDSFIFANAEEKRFKTTLEQLVGAAAQFQRAATTRFGEEAARNGFPNLPLGVPAHIIAPAKEQITGDAAIVDVAKGGQPIELIRVNGEWRTTVGQFYHLSAAVLEEYCLRLVSALRQVATEIPAGTYATAMDAVDAVKHRAR